MNEDSFFSIDRLVEFGMGLAMARQMVQTMNYAMQNMQVPGVMNPLQSQQFYYVIIDNKQVGPISEQELSNLIANKQVTKDSYIWKPGFTNWKTAEQLPEILKLVALMPPPFDK